MYHCALTGGGSTHPITNWTNIISLDSAELVAHIVKNQHFPINQLPTFMHEFMHHWCFHSPVGFVVAESYLSARRYAIHGILTTYDINSDAYWQSCHDTLRFRIFNTLFRPLSEGLALFAEHDSYLGQETLLSELFRCVYCYFSTPEQLNADLINNEQFKSLSLLLFHNRTSMTAEQRKVQLLTQSLAYSTQEKSIGVQGGYLAGYLTIKNLQAILIHKGCKQFLDPDFFLCFVRSYFFEDYGLIDHILNPIIGEEDYIEKIVIYFQNRMIYLIEQVTPKLVDAYEKWALDEKLRLDLINSPLQVDSDISLSGKSRCTELYNRLSKPIPDENLEKMRQADHWTIAQRNIICVGTFASDIIVSDNRVLVYRNNNQNSIPICSLPKYGYNDIKSGPGRVECFISPVSNLFSIVVSRNGMPIAFCHIRNPDDPNVLRDFQNYRFGSEEIANSVNNLDAAIDLMLAECALDEYFNALVNVVEIASESIYKNKAIKCSKDSLFDLAHSALASDGIYGLLGKDYSATEGLAALSLATSISNSPEFVSQHLMERGHDINIIIDACEKVEQKFGVSLLLINEECIFSFV